MSSIFCTFNREIWALYVPIFHIHIQPGWYRCHTKKANKQFITVILQTVVSKLVCNIFRKRELCVIGPIATHRWFISIGILYTPRETIVVQRCSPWSWLERNATVVKFRRFVYMCISINNNRYIRLHNRICLGMISTDIKLPLYAEDWDQHHLVFAVECTEKWWHFSW